MASIAEKISVLRAGLPTDVRLVCVSKFQPETAIKEAYEAGERDFGESRVQELQRKTAVLPNDIRWHFIGHLQTNKVRDLLRLRPYLIQSVDSERLLKAIQREAETQNIEQNILLEVHVAHEETKSGFIPEELQGLFGHIRQGEINLSHVRICGLMAMATNTDDTSEIRRCFMDVHRLFMENYRIFATNGEPILSIGMSDDYPIAIDCGSTMVRIGSSIFGERKKADQTPYPYKAVFFDMDGVLYDSMPYHAKAWEEAMTAHGLPFTAEDAYRNEGRTGKSVIQEAFVQVNLLKNPNKEVHISQEQLDALAASIYAEKSAAFQRMRPNGAEPMQGITEVLNWLHKQGIQCWIVTGSGQRSLLDRINQSFPGIFQDEKVARVISSFDVSHGKPDPEPYIKAWERSGLPKEACCIVENAPLGVRAGKAAGIFTIAVNTGILDDELLRAEKADVVHPDMTALLQWFKQNAGQN